jgi:hypothetical protein
MKDKKEKDLLGLAFGLGQTGSPTPRENGQILKEAIDLIASAVLKSNIIDIKHGV